MQHGARADTQLRGYYRKGTAGAVHPGSFGEVDSIGHAMPYLDTRATKVPDQGAPIDTELPSKRVRRLPRLVPANDL